MTRLLSLRTMKRGSVLCPVCNTLRDFKNFDFEKDECNQCKRRSEEDGNV